jgi:hypothetical protein
MFLRNCFNNEKDVKLVGIKLCRYILRETSVYNSHLCGMTRISNDTLLFYNGHLLGYMFEITMN